MSSVVLTIEGHPVAISTFLRGALACLTALLNPARRVVRGSDVLHLYTEFSVDPTKAVQSPVPGCPYPAIPIESQKENRGRLSSPRFSHHCASQCAEVMFLTVTWLCPLLGWLVLVTCLRGPTVSHSPSHVYPYPTNGTSLAISTITSYKPL